jgi:hypothetical protein
MADFGCVAIQAHKLCKNGINPREAWDEVCKKLGFSETMQKKDCPKSTFLGLCEEGLVKDIPEGSYTRSKKNKTYGLKAIDRLIENHNLARSSEKLWEAIGN